MKRFYKAVFIFLSCFFLSIQVHASHIMGANITYTYIGTNGSGGTMYVVRLGFYRDCCPGCLVAGPSPTLTVSNAGTSCTPVITSTYNLVEEPQYGPNGTEVVTLCPGTQSSCDNLSSTYPGVEKYVDSVIITLPSACSDWTVSWTDGARNATITNLQNPSSQSIYIQALINNTINPATGLPYATNSVYFTNEPVPFACLGNTNVVTYSNGAVAPIGDSLVYTLVNPLTGPGAPIAYVPGYTSSQPILSNPPVNFSSTTGIMSYQPSQTEVDVITFLVQQYVNGVLASSVMRDVQLTVINCSLPASPTDGTPINLVNADTTGGSIRVCPGTTDSFQIAYIDPNGRNVTLTSDINGIVSSLPGATFYQTGIGDSVIAHFAWTPTIADTGCHSFQVNVSTNDCPIPGTSIKAYTICVLTKVTVAPHSIIYCGTPIHLTATGGSNATWTPTTGLTFPTSIYAPLAAPTVTTLYTFTSDCGSDTALIIYNPPFNMSAGPGGSICQSNLIQLNGSTDNTYAPYSILWIPSIGLTNPITGTADDSILNPEASPPQTTTYTLQVTANTGCIRTDTVTVNVNGYAPAIHAHVDTNMICPGEQVKLWVTDEPTCGLATSNRCTGNATIIQVGTGANQQGGSGFVYPSPYGNFYESARHQFLFQASELASLLGSGGQINSISMDIATLNSGSTLDNFTIRMGCVSVDSLTGYVDENLLSTVYVANYTPVTGWNTHILTTPYNWDGVSNLVIDVCFKNLGGSNINNKMWYTPTPFRSVFFTYTNSTSGACGYSGNPPVTTYNNYVDRPNFKFNFCILPITNITWTPNTGPNGVTLPHADTTYATPISQTTYTVTMNDTATGCSSASFVTVFVDTAVQFALSPDSFICTSSPVRLHAVTTIAAGSSATQNSIVYTWSAVPATSAAPPSGTGPGFATPIVTPTATTTYICTITGPGVCPITDSVKIILGTGLPVSGIVDSVKCTGNNNGKIVIDMTQGTAPYTYTWSPPAANIDSIMNLAPGTYYVTVTDAGGCIGHDTFTLAAPIPLTLSFDSSNILCFGVNIDTIKALVSGGRSPYRYTWNPAAANTSTLTGLAVGTYDLTVTDTSGCTISGAVNITQPTPVVSSLISTNLSGANSNNGTITVTTNGGVGPYTYSCDSAITGLPNAINLDTGVYIITVCDANHCCVKDTAHITGPPPIAITFVVSNNQCFGQCIGTATLTAVGGVLPYTYQWSDLTTSTSLGTSTTITNLCAGTYQVVVTDANGITVSKDTVISAPTAIGEKIDSTPITCNGLNNGVLFDSIYGGTPPYTIIWNPGGGVNPLTNLAPGMYIANVTDANGCPAADTAYLGQPAPLTAAIISTDSVTCFGTLTGYANVQGIGGRPPYTYTWSGSNSVDSFAGNLAAGAQTVTVKDAAGCTYTVPFTIYQPTQLAITAIDTTPAHCASSNDGSAIAIVSGGSPAYTYTWDGTSTGNVDSITGLASGVHTLSVTDSKGCVQSMQFTISTQYVLNISILSDSVTCNGGSDGIAYTQALNGYPAYSYHWSPAGSTTDSATGLAASTQSVTVTDIYGCTATSSVVVGQPNPITDVVGFTNPLCTSQANGKVWISAGGTVGPYTYTFNGGATVYQITDTVLNVAQGSYSLTITDGRGCTKTDSVTLTNPLQLNVPPPTFANISCANEANGYIQVSPTGGTQPYSYTWSKGGYTDSTESNLGPGNYIITVTDANGCSVSVSDSLSAPPLISFLSIESDPASCPDSADGHIAVSATGGTPGDTVPYTYSIDGVNYSANNNFYNLAAGTYTVYVKDGQGCILDTAIVVTQPYPVTVSITPTDSLIVLGATIELFSIINNPTGESINSYAWTPSAGLSCLDCPNPYSSPYQNIQYYLTVNYGKNCTTTATNTIEVQKAGVYIPNAFTPNGDGINDVFEVFGTTLYSVSMKIFNRWGEKIFDSEDNQWATWDGTYKGVMQPPGVYVYYVTLVFLDGTTSTREGSVTLIR